MLYCAGREHMKDLPGIREGVVLLDEESDHRIEQLLLSQEDDALVLNGSIEHNLSAVLVWAQLHSKCTFMLWTGASHFAMRLWSRDELRSKIHHIRDRMPPRA